MRIDLSVKSFGATMLAMISVKNTLSLPQFQSTSWETCASNVSTKPAGRRYDCQFSYAYHGSQKLDRQSNRARTLVVRASSQSSERHGMPSARAVKNLGLLLGWSDRRNTRSMLLSTVH